MIRHNVAGLVHRRAGSKITFPWAALTCAPLQTHGCMTHSRQDPNTHTLYYYSVHNIIDCKRTEWQKRVIASPNTNLIARMLPQSLRHPVTGTTTVHDTCFLPEATAVTCPHRATRRSSSLGALCNNAQLRARWLTSCQLPDPCTSPQGHAGRGGCSLQHLLHPGGSSTSAKVTRVVEGDRLWMRGKMCSGACNVHTLRVPHCGQIAADRLRGLVHG
jgi:hypothetical protein